MTAKKNNNLIWHKSNAAFRYFLAHTLSGIMPYYIVNEYPKSGGSWLATMLAEAFNVPFPRNRLPMLVPSILHGHMMHTWNLCNLILLWRDGRDVLVSQYFHWLFQNDRGNARLVNKCRKDLGFNDYEDIQNNLVPFMEYVYENPRHPRFTWTEFVSRWQGKKSAINVRYEDLLTTPVESLKNIYKKLSGLELDDTAAKQIVYRNSFSVLHGREPGVEIKGSFARKGIAGDWKNHFTKEARIAFKDYAGESLIKLGYEPDDNWANEKHFPNPGSGRFSINGATT